MLSARPEQSSSASSSLGVSRLELGLQCPEDGAGRGAQEEERVDSVVLTRGGCGDGEHLLACHGAIDAGMRHTSSGVNGVSGTGIGGEDVAPTNPRFQSLVVAAGWAAASSKFLPPRGLERRRWAKGQGRHDRGWGAAERHRWRKGWGGDWINNLSRIFLFRGGR